MKLRAKLSLICLLFAPSVYAQTAFPTYHFAGTVTVGGTFQTVATTGAPSVRQSIEFVNVCSVSGNCNATTDVCYVYMGSGTANTANSIIVQPSTPGNSYLRSSGAIPNDAIQVTCTATGDKFLLNVQ